MFLKKLLLCMIVGRMKLHSEVSSACDQSKSSVLFSCQVLLFWCCYLFKRSVTWLQSFLLLTEAAQLASDLLTCRQRLSDQQLPAWLHEMHIFIMFLRLFFTRVFIEAARTGASPTWSDAPMMNVAVSITL